MAENYNNEHCKFFDKEKLDEMISNYLNEIDSFWEDEEYKWKAVKHFQEHWNIDSENFEEMLKDSTSKVENLLVSRLYYPLAVYYEIVKSFPEELRELFRALYDENLDIVERINAFQQGVGDLYKRTLRPGKNTYQDLRAVSNLLWLRYPDKYYIYKSREFKTAIKRLASEAPKLNGKAECYPMFLEYMDDLRSYFVNTKLFKEKFSTLINNVSLYADKSLHTATIDFVFYAGKRFDPNIITPSNSLIINNNRDMDEYNIKLLEEYKYFLLNCTALKESSVSNYTDFKRLNDCIKELNNGFLSVLDYSDPDAFYQLMIDLENLQSYKDINDGGGNQYSNALKYYLRFLLARKYFGTKSKMLIRRNKLNNKPLQIIYYGAPGTGKSYGIKKNHGVTRENSYRTTFHPDTDYSSFVGCYKPTMKVFSKRNISEGQLANILKDRINNPNFKYPYHKFGFDYWRELSNYTKKDYGEWIKQANGKESLALEIGEGEMLGEYSSKRVSDEITYEFVPQVFTEAYIAAWRGYAEDSPVFLVIEEINRGNCAQIFGDLFQLLDRNEMGFSDYEIKPEKDLQQYLEDEFAGNHELPALELSGFEKVISGEELILPPNFNIIATMNTSDQSLFPIDSAFKRRWSWRYVAIKDYEEKNYRIEVDGILYKWWDFVAQVNAKIKDVTESEDKTMGYFFVRPDKKEQETDENATIITTDNFVSKVLFYLWADVFKDYANDVENNIFRKKLATQEGTKYVSITFSDFFDRDGKVNMGVLKAFLSQFNLDSNSISEDENFEIEEQSSNTMTITVNGDVYEIGGAGSAEKIVSALLTLDKTDLEQVFNSEQNTKVLNGRCRLIDNELMPSDDPVIPQIQSNVYSQYRNSMKLIGDTGYYVQAYPPQRRRLFALLSNVLGSNKFSFTE